MKLQCDFCSIEPASIFCFADEAALCDSCDHKIHHANKVASKHSRFSLLYPSSSQTVVPLCDICQKKKGSIFCKEDRSVICKDCDLTVHSASDLTREHTRYLVTGVQLSSEPIADAPMIVEEAETSSIYNVYNQNEAGVSGFTETDSNANSIYTEYFINSESAWQLDEMEFDNSVTTPTSFSNSQYYEHGELNDHGSLAGFTFWAQQKQFLY